MTQPSPAEHCGHQPDHLVSRRLTECVLRPGHSGSHADQTGMRWWLAKQADAPTRHTVDTLTSDALDQLYATVQRLNRRAQAAESENARYRRAVAQWDVSERGTYIPHASLVAIGRAAGTDVLGSVRHLKHFERVEQAEAANERVRDLHAKEEVRATGQYGESYWTAQCGHCHTEYPCPTRAALAPQEQ